MHCNSSVTCHLMRAKQLVIVWKSAKSKSYKWHTKQRTVQKWCSQDPSWPLYASKLHTYFFWKWNSLVRNFCMHIIMLTGHVFSLRHYNIISNISKPNLYAFASLSRSSQHQKWMSNQMCVRLSSSALNYVHESVRSEARNLNTTAHAMSWFIKTLSVNTSWLDLHITDTYTQITQQTGTGLVT